MKEKLIRGKDCPWLTEAIRRDMKERDYYLTKARNQNTGLFIEDTEIVSQLLSDIKRQTTTKIYYTNIPTNQKRFGQL